MRIYFLSWKGEYREALIKYYAKGKNSEDFDQNYARLTITLDSLEMEVANETHVYEPGDSYE